MKAASVALCAPILFVSAAFVNAPPARAARPRAQQPSSQSWTEGRCQEVEGLHIRRVEFVGNETTPHATVNRAMLLVEGDPFSCARLRRGLRRLNALGRFYRVTERDVAWRRATHYDEVDFVITLRERPRRRRR